MVWPAIAAFVGSALAGAAGQRSANNMNMDLSREGRDWQEAMRRTNYQAAKWDLEQAGFNPMLSLMQGGASTPSTQVAKVENVAGAGIASGLQGAQMMNAAQQMSQSDATIKKTEAETKMIASQTMEHSVNTAMRAAELKRTQAEAKEKGVSADVAFRTQNATEEGRIAEAVLKQLEASRSKETFSEDVARRKAESRITQFGEAEARAGSKFYEDVEGMPKYLRLLIDLVRGGNSAQSILRR